MKLLVIVAALSLHVGAAAQIQASLTPSSPLAVDGDEAEFILRVAVTEDSEIDATVLRGIHLQVAEDGKTIKTIGKRVRGKEHIVGKTTIERVIRATIDLPGDSAETRTVTLTWKGLPTATTELDVAPAPELVDLDALDPTSTQVVLRTNFGNIRIGFLPDVAPNHVRNFLELTRDRFYDDTRFHRVWRGFMLQGGCPNTKPGATGTPGNGARADQKTIAAEFSDHDHTRGTVSMARNGDLPDSASCQFFIVHQNSPHLNGKYSAFGRVLEGMDVVDRIAGVAVTAQPNGENTKPVEPVHLYRCILLPATKD